MNMCYSQWLKMPLSRRLLIALILSSMVPATTIATEVQFAADWTLSTPNGQAINLADEADPVTFINDAGYDFTLLLEGDAVAEN